MGSARFDDESVGSLPVDLANTVHLSRGRMHDVFSTEQSLADWLRRRQSDLFVELPARDLSTIDDEGLQEARRLRDCVLSLVTALAGGHDLAPVDVQMLNHYAGAAPHWNELRLGRPPRARRRTTAPALRAALGELAEATIDMITREPPPTIRACQAPGCVRHFIGDHPRREWCSPRCGNRTRVARHYRRERGRTDD